jgi:hypothetical protein
VVIMFVALIVVILALNRPEIREVRGVQKMIARERRSLGRLSRGDRNVLLARRFTLNWNQASRIDRGTIIPRSSTPPG